ncbi:copper homeostasis protein CutC [Marinifilum sp. RC60d5]|uniref:copper homeostasis protein CutC n=1 Tax=Marinifilum sp. RC60d5 TaxID=3458414 RepID=UPI00403559B8
MELGADRILTSGGMQTANEGANLLKDLVEIAKDRIIIMPGSGVNHSNIQSLLDIMKAKEFHCSAKSLVNRKMSYHNPNINMGGEESIPEFEYYEADSQKIRKIVSILKAEDH